MPMTPDSATGPVLAPRYVARFACTAGDCPDGCCAGGPVPLDAAALGRLEACEDPELRAIAAASVVRGPEPGAGRIEPGADACRTCPFLDGGRLCRIHARLGAGALPESCATYPREGAELNGLGQLALRLSCPEAAGLALLDEDAMELEALEPEGWALPRVEPRQGLDATDMEEVRTQLFQVLQTRELDLSLRLAVAGIFCQRLDELLQGGKGANLPGLFQAMDAVLENGAVQVPLKAPAVRRDLRVRVAKLALQGMGGPTSSPRVLRVLDEAAAGLEGGAADGEAKLALALEPCPWLLEHHLLNTAFREVFPWAPGGPFLHYARLMLDFAVLRGMLEGRAAARPGTLTPEELVETVQVFSRWAEAGSPVLAKLRQESADWITLGPLLALV